MNLSGLSELLGVSSPWYISDVKLQKENAVLDVFIEFNKGSKFNCPVCGESRSVYDSSYTRIRHLDIFEYRCYLNIKLPRIDCPRDGVKTISGNNWSRKGSHYSFKFESLVIRLCQQMSVSGVSSELGEPDNNLWRIFQYYVKNEIVDNFDFRAVKRVCVDETAIKRGHNYVSIFTDYDTGNVLYVADGRSKEVFDEFYGWLWDKGGFPGNIELFSLDMSKSYKAGQQSYFAHAEVVFDRFHIVQSLNKAINKVRIRELKTTESLKKTKYIWLKNPQNLTETQKMQLDAFLTECALDTAKAYSLKTSFRQLWEVQIKAVIPAVKKWIEKAVAINLKPINAFVETVTNNFDGIINSMITGINNAISEGLNSVMQIARSRARGYRNTDNFKAMIYCLGNR